MLTLSLRLMNCLPSANTDEQMQLANTDEQMQLANTDEQLQLTDEDNQEQRKIENDVLEAVLDALVIQDDFSTSQEHFMRVLSYGRDLYCKGDPQPYMHVSELLHDKHNCISCLCPCF